MRERTVPIAIRERAIRMTETTFASECPVTPATPAAGDSVPDQCRTDTTNLASGYTVTPVTPPPTAASEPSVSKHDPLPTTAVEVQVPSSDVDGVPGVTELKQAGGSQETQAPPADAAVTPPALSPDDGVSATFISFGPYHSSADGLYYVSNDDEEKTARLCGPIEVVALTRDIGGSGWGIFVRFADRDGRAHSVVIQSEQLAKGSGDLVLSLLMQQGLVVSPKRGTKANLIEYLSLATTPARLTVVASTGWHGNEYVIPDRVLGATESSDLLFSNSKTTSFLASEGGHFTAAYEQKGTLEEWKNNVARFAIGNSRLMLALGAGFAAPLLRPLGIEGGGYHFMGASSVGKTTITRVSASIYSGRDFVLSWRATNNGLEGVAAARNDACLHLDEVSQADPAEVGPAIYMLASGVGKVRSTKEGSARAPSRFRVMVLSTGEIGIAAHMAQDRFSKARHMAGQGVRLLDIQADTNIHGAFEDLHGHATGAALSDHLRWATEQYFGTAFEPFVRAIIALDDEGRDRLQARVRETIRDMLYGQEEGQVVRAAERFAICSVAAEFAAEVGIAPWSKAQATDGI